MENYLLYFSAFVFGIVFNKMWNYLYGIGSGIVMTKQAIRDSLLILSKNIQSAYEINHLKYLALEMSDKDERFVNFQKSRDKMELSSMKNTSIRNLINSISPRYDNLVPFHNWEGAMDYLDNELKEQKEQ